MKISLASDLDAWRGDARARVDQHFNEIAVHRLHHDMAQLASGKPASDLLAREARRRELFALIAAAQTPAQIEDVLSSLT